MDKIYSRKRLLIPKLRRKVGGKRSGSIGRVFNSNIGGLTDNRIPKKFDKKLVKTALIVIIAVFIANRIISVIEPRMDVLCIDMAKSVATKVTNEQASIVMEKYKYEDISNVVRDENGNIKMIQMNVGTVNAITSDVALKIQKGLENCKSDEFSIKLGTFTRH